MTPLTREQVEREGYRNVVVKCFWCKTRHNRLSMLACIESLQEQIKKAKAEIRRLKRARQALGRDGG